MHLQLVLVIKRPATQHTVHPRGLLMHLPHMRLHRVLVLIGPAAHWTVASFIALVVYFADVLFQSFGSEEFRIALKTGGSASRDVRVGVEESLHVAFQVEIDQ